MSANDELHQRERRLNRLALSLDERDAALDRREQALRELETQSSEVRLANEYLIVATIEAQELREAAQTASRRQDEFLAMLAHELRNPLGPIRNAVEILARLDAGQPVPRPILDIIRRQVQQMVRLLDDLLDVARLTQGKVTLQQRPTAITEFINQAVASTNDLVKARTQQLTLELPASPLHVHGDAVRLSQVFFNLLQNASKYTQAGGSITLRAERKGDAVVVRVIDNGMGISPDALPYVFDLFAQGERAIARSQGGLGIGLAVVRRMVELHKGTVEAFSGGRGQGSEFIVTLPRLEHRGEAETALRTRGLLAPLPARILLIEDNVDAGEVLAQFLRQAGHQVSVALDGQAGLGCCDHFKPQLVLCDIGLPGMDGYEVAIEMRKRWPTKRPILVALTGYGSAQDLHRAIAAGYDHHVVKPADPENLLRIIDSTMLSLDWFPTPGASSSSGAQRC